MLKGSLCHAEGITALVALALGYIVCTLAKKEAGALKKIGQIIGAAVIAISAVVIIVKVLCTLCSSSGMCPLKSKMMHHSMPADSLLQK